jgi:hypothetical protein
MGTNIQDVTVERLTVLKCIVFVFLKEKCAMWYVIILI